MALKIKFNNIKRVEINFSALFLLENKIKKHGLYSKWNIVHEIRNNYEERAKPSFQTINKCIFQFVTYSLANVTNSIGFYFQN